MWTMAALCTNATQTLQVKARLAAKNKKKEDPKKKAVAAAVAAEAAARKAKLGKQKDSSKFNQVGRRRGPAHAMRAMA